MNHADQSAPSWPIDPGAQQGLFAGVADAYAQYRPTYPPDLIDYIAPTQAGLRRCVDLATGTGQLAGLLAARVASVLAVDIEPDMVRKTGELTASLGNVTVLRSAAEELAVEAQSIDLVTVGNAFHRFNRSDVATKAMTWLRPGRQFVVTGCSVFGGAMPWHSEINAVLQSGTQRRQRTPQQEPTDHAEPTGPGEHRPTARHEEIMDLAGFQDIEEVSFWQARTLSPNDVFGFITTLSTALSGLTPEETHQLHKKINSIVSAHASNGKIEDRLEFFVLSGRRPS